MFEDLLRNLLGRRSKKSPGGESQVVRSERSRHRGREGGMDGARQRSGNRVEGREGGATRGAAGADRGLGEPRLAPDSRVPPDSRHPGAAGGESAAGEVLMASGVIETEVQLAAALTFSQCLSETVGLAAHLYAHICPLELNANAKLALLLVSPDFRGRDEVREVLKLLAQKGYKLRPGPHPNVFQASSGQILSIARGHTTAADLATAKRIHSNPQESALLQLFGDVVAWAFREKASDIHVNVFNDRVRSEIRFTINGKYVAPERWRLPSVQLGQMLSVAWQKGRGGREPTFIPTIEQQCNIHMQIKGSQERVMLRWASMATDDGPQVTMRLLQLDAMQHTVTLEELGYLPSHISMLHRAMKAEGGSIIFAGVVGSGKSTTIATVMSSIPTTRKVETIEDPREYIIPGSHANTVSRPLDGSGDKAFHAKLATLKRAAFNDLLLGEIRDHETGMVFQDVVLTGQNLYSTTHARRAIGIPDKLASPMVGVARDVLATPGTFKLLVYQSLLPVNCPHCKVSGLDMLNAPGGEEAFGGYIARLQRLYGFGAERIYFRNENGCPECRREGLPDLNGLKGRTVVAEMIEPDDEMLSHIKTGDNLALQRHVASLPRSGYTDPNMDNKSTLECAIYKMSLGLIDPREIEPRFASFETIELRRQRSAEARARSLRVVGSSAPPVVRRERKSGPDDDAGAIPALN